MTGKATRLYPLPPRELPAESIYADLELPPAERRDPARPYVAVNMVSSLDGKTTVGGKAARLGSRTDRQTMRNLRARADAVMIGANTLRAEKLSLGLDSPRQGRQPLAVIVTRSGDLPLESNLILAEQQELLVVSPREGGYVDLGETLNYLKAERLVDLLVVEGGPTLNHQLISRGLADELFLTLAPEVIGGRDAGSLTIVSGELLPLEASSAELLSVNLAGGELFLRYHLT